MPAPARTWDDKQSGQKRSKLKLIGETMQMLGIPRGGGAANGGDEVDRAGAPATKRRRKPLRRPAGEDEFRFDLVAA